MRRSLTGVHAVQLAVARRVEGGGLDDVEVDTYAEVLDREVRLAPGRWCELAGDWAPGRTRNTRCGQDLRIKKKGREEKRTREGRTTSREGSTSVAMRQRGGGGDLADVFDLREHVSLERKLEVVGS